MNGFGHLSQTPNSEHAVSTDTLSTKTRVPLGMVAAVLLFVIPLVGAAYVGREDVASLKLQIADVSAKVAFHDAGIGDIKQDIRAMQEGMKFQTQLLQEIRQEQRELRRAR